MWACRRRPDWSLAEPIVRELVSRGAVVECLDRRMRMALLELRRCDLIAGGHEWRQCMERR